MRTTVDLPDELHRAIKMMAAERGTTVRELVLEGLEMAMRTKKEAGRGLELSAVPSAEPRSLEIDRETNDELIGFP